MGKRKNTYKRSKINLEINIEASREEWDKLLEKITEISDYAYCYGVEKAVDKFAKEKMVRAKLFENT